MDSDFLCHVYIISTIAVISGIVLAALDVTDWRLAIMIVGLLYWLFSLVAALSKKDQSYGTIKKHWRMADYIGFCRCIHGSINILC